MRLADRFASKYIPEPNSGCWLWLGNARSDGYGCIDCRNTRGSGTVLKAHRVSYELHCGPIPDGLSVLHRCDVPCCVNPDHLFLGTIADNNRDCLQKGRVDLRNLYRKGEDHGRALLSEDDVRAIRRSRVRLIDIAAHYGVSVATASNARRGASWKHIS